MDGEACEGCDNVSSEGPWRRTVSKRELMVNCTTVVAFDAGHTTRCGYPLRKILALAR